MGLFGDKVRARDFAHEQGVPTIPGSLEGASRSGCEATLACCDGRGLSDPAQSGFRRRWPGHAAGGRRNGNGRCVQSAAPARRRRPLAMAGCFSRNASSGRDTSRCRFSVTAAATWCTYGSGTARSRFDIRRWWKLPRRRDLDPGLRERLLADAVKMAAAAGYQNAGTVEFLVSPETRRILVHRVQSADPGGAHHHRAGNGCRPG